MLSFSNPEMIKDISELAIKVVFFMGIGVGRGQGEGVKCLFTRFCHFLN